MSVNIINIQILIFSYFQFKQGDSVLESNRLKERGFISGLSGLLGSSPVTEGVHDGRSLPALVQRKPLDDMSSGQSPKIPLLIGITKHEAKRAIQSKIFVYIIKCLFIFTILLFLCNKEVIFFVDI